MSERLYATDDFEARIRIFSSAEDGRSTPAFNVIRWDFAYADDPGATLYMISPDFLDHAGNSRPKDEPLPIGEELTARMMIVVDEMREQVHRARIVPGVRFSCREGRKPVAEGTVTRITGLFEPRAARPTASIVPGTVAGPSIACLGMDCRMFSRKDLMTDLANLLAAPTPPLEVVEHGQQDFEPPDSEQYIWAFRGLKRDFASGPLFWVKSLQAQRWEGRESYFLPYVETGLCEPLTAHEFDSIVVEYSESLQPPVPPFLRNQSEFRLGVAHVR